MYVWMCLSICVVALRVCAWGGFFHHHQHHNRTPPNKPPNSTTSSEGESPQVLPLPYKLNSTRTSAQQQQQQQATRRAQQKIAGPAHTPGSVVCVRQQVCKVPTQGNSATHTGTDTPPTGRETHTHPFGSIKKGLLLPPTLCGSGTASTLPRQQRVS